MELIRHCAGKLNTLSCLILTTPQQAPVSSQAIVIAHILYMGRLRFRNFNGGRGITALLPTGADHWGSACITPGRDVPPGSGRGPSALYLSDGLRGVAKLF